MAHEMNHAAEVRTFNQKHKELVARGEDTLTLQTSWVNLHLSFAGLQQLGADGLDALPDEFKQGMRARAGVIGDVNESDPTNWTGPFAPNSGFAVHALVIVAADSASLLDERTASVRAIIATSGVTEFASAQHRQTRPAPFTGHEHLGSRTASANRASPASPTRAGAATTSLRESSSSATRIRTATSAASPAKPRPRPHRRRATTRSSPSRHRSRYRRGPKTPPSSCTASCGRTLQHFVPS